MTDGAHDHLTVPAHTHPAPDLSGYVKRADFDGWVNNYTLTLDARIHAIDARVKALERPPFTNLPGWTLLMSEEFDTDVARGHFLDGSTKAGSDGAPQTADGKWQAYKYGWQDTSKHGFYDPSLIAVTNSCLDILVPGYAPGGVPGGPSGPRIATIRAIPPGSTSKGGITTGGRFLARIRADRMPGYKGVPMWWPDGSQMGVGGGPELDGPEGNFDALPKAYTHPNAGWSTGQTWFAYPAGTSWQDWHDYVTEWIPGGKVRYLLDGVLVGESPCPPTPTPMHANLQFESQLGTGLPAPDPSVTGHIQIDRFALWAA